MVNHLFRRVRDYFAGSFSQLMVFLILLFIFRPYNWSTLSTAIWEFFFTGVFFSSIFNAHHPRPVRIITILLGIPALALDWTSLFYPIPHLIIASLCFTILFLYICTASILYNVVLRARVTLETLRGVICAYFMIAFAFAFLYLLIEFIYPGSFHLNHSSENYIIHSAYLSQMFYFSFTTLLTIGFGDITPITDFSQSFVVLEGVIGQFYIAILVAKIVSVYSFFSDKAMMKQLEKDIADLSDKIRKK